MPKGPTINKRSRYPFINGLKEKDLKSRRSWLIFCQDNVPAHIIYLSCAMFWVLNWPSPMWLIFVSNEAKVTKLMKNISEDKSTALLPILKERYRDREKNALNEIRYPLCNLFNKSFKTSVWLFYSYSSCNRTQSVIGYETK